MFTTYSTEEKHSMLQYVRTVITNTISRIPLPPPPGVNGIHRLGSCFVTLHSANGTLRGCIGNIQAVESLGDNLRHNAVNAAFHDPRFPALSSKEELSSLELEISILTPMTRVNGPEEFIVGTHGIYMTCLGRAAVFLPQVAPEQGWDHDTTLSYLCQKAGLPPDSWERPDAEFNVFEAIVFSEKSLKGDK